MRAFVCGFLVLAASAAAPAAAGLFSATEPELIYSGTAMGVGEGVLVIRDKAALEQALAPLAPAFDGAPPDIGKRTILRVTGRDRENGCRDTLLKEVSTRGMSATVKLEERVPGPNCVCPAEARAPRVFLVSVARAVRNAEIIKTDVVIPCSEAEAARVRAASEASLIFEGSWDAPAGADVVVEPEEYKKILGRLGIADRGPAVDFEHERIVAVTGRARENGCRKTTVTAARIVGTEDAEFEVEESYPQKGQACTQVMMQPRLFLYRVPATVMRAKLTTREVR